MTPPSACKKMLVLYFFLSTLTKKRVCVSLCFLISQVHKHNTLTESTTSSTSDCKTASRKISSNYSIVAELSMSDELTSCKITSTEACSTVETKNKKVETRKNILSN